MKEERQSTPGETDRAVENAAAAFPLYRRKSAAEKAAFLEAIALEIDNCGEELILVCMGETALPRARIEGEKARTVNQLKMFASLVREGSWVDARIETARPGRVPVPKPDLRSMHIALGPVVVFGAGNFPLAFSVAGGDTASALAAGCPGHCKGPSRAPGHFRHCGQGCPRRCAQYRYARCRLSCCSTGVRSATPLKKQRAE